MTGLTTSMTITGLGQPLQLNEDEIELAPKLGKVFGLYVRFHLKGELPPGTYPVPILISARRR